MQKDFYQIFQPINIRVNQSFVNGVWQDHTILNNFSVEAVYEKKVEIRKVVEIVLIIDLNNEQTVNEWRL